MSGVFETSVTPSEDTRGRSSFVRSLSRSPVAVGAIAFLVLLIVACVAAPLIAPYGAREQDLHRVLTGPTAHNLLGTDTLGRDVLSRLMYGGRRSLLSIVEGLAVVLALGVPLGLVAGYAGGWSDRALSRMTELLMAIPAIIFILVILAVVPRNEDVAMVAFGLLGAPVVLRVVRGATLKIREELYITAARVSGLSHVRIVARHVLPRVSGPVIVQATIFAAYALLFETGLAYLGLTADPQTPTWGGMVAEGSTVIQQQSWLLIPSGALIAVTILALGLLGDAVRDAAVVGEGAHHGRGLQAKPGPGVHSGGDGEELPAGRSDALLQVRNLTVSLSSEEGATCLIDDVSFDILPGETLGLVGESGCGKSVTALALLRLLPTNIHPVNGHVLFSGADLLAIPERDFEGVRGSGLAYVSQEPQASLDPTFTIGSQLVEVIRHHDGLSRSKARARALELLRLVDLPAPEKVARSRVHQLSGGMAQRVAMALALAGRPKLLIADEPTTALDVTVQAEILGLLRGLQRDSGMAILLITHNWGVVADICERTIVMYAGQIVEECGVQEMFDRPLHPYTRGLLESHPSLVSPGHRLSALPGRVPPPGAWPKGCRFAPRCRFATDECRAQAIGLEEPEAGRLARCIRVERVVAEVHA